MSRRERRKKSRDQAPIEKIGRLETDPYAIDVAAYKDRKRKKRRRQIKKATNSALLLKTVQGLLQSELQSTSDLMKPNKKLPGEIRFGRGRHVEAFVVGLAGNLDAEEAIQIGQHEKKHADALRIYGVGVRYSVIVTWDDDGTSLLQPLATPIFPSSMPKADRLRALRAAYEAVTDPSDGDINGLKRLRRLTDGT